MSEGGFILSIMPQLLQGAVTSVLVALAAIALGIVLGIIVCQMRRSSMSACPQDILPINGKNCTPSDVQYTVYRP